MVPKVRAIPIVLLRNGYLTLELTAKLKLFKVVSPGAFLNFLTPLL
jgi:hypothetical protein